MNLNNDKTVFNFLFATHNMNIGKIVFIFFFIILSYNKKVNALTSYDIISNDYLVNSGLNIPCVSPMNTHQDPVLIAVLTFDAINVNIEETYVVTERLRYYLAYDANFQVLERDRMDDILREQGFQLTGACDTKECVVQVGKILGVRKMVAGSVSKVEQLYSLHVRLIDIETSTIETQAYRNAESMEDILEVATRDVVEVLAGASQLTLVSALQGARILIDGSEIPEITPARDIRIRSGYHDIQVKAPGYHSWYSSVDLGSGETASRVVDLHPKSRITAGGLSLLVPGLGQLYSGRSLTGLGFFIPHMVLGVYTGIQFNDYKQSRNNYEERVDQYLTGRFDNNPWKDASDLKELHDEMVKQRGRINRCVYYLLGLWIINALEAFVYMPRLSPVSQSSQNTQICIISKKDALKLQFTWGLFNR